MTTSAEASAIIKTRLETQVAWVAPAPMIVKPNTGASLASSDEYVELSIPTIYSTQRSMGTLGNRRYQYVGEAHFACYVPLRTGDARVLAMSKAISDAFVGKNIDGVIFRKADEILRDKTNARYFLVLMIEFDYYSHL